MSTEDEKAANECWEEYRDNNPPKGQAQFYYKDNEEYWKAGFNRALSHARKKECSIELTCKGGIFECQKEELTARCEKLEQEAQQRILKYGGQGIGQVYGLANCEFCKELTNDYFLIGKSQLCPECFDSFPKSSKAIEAVEKSC